MNFMRFCIEIFSGICYNNIICFEIKATPDKPTERSWNGVTIKELFYGY